MSNTESQNETPVLNEQQSKTNIKDILETFSNIEKHLASIAYSLDYLIFNDKRGYDRFHPIPD